MSVDMVDPVRLNQGDHFGPYKIIRFLGRGGMGEVYQAENLESGSLVALKLLDRKIVGPDRERFLREGRVAASVSHPNSVYVYGTAEIEGTPVIAMEYVSGGTLDEQVQNYGPFDSRAAVDAALQLIDGLEAAAEKKVLHRDIKPANCFQSRDGTIKIGDFGLSRSLTEEHETRLTLAGGFVGTPSYASPEQLQSDTTDLRSDIYSLGATLYFLLTGRPPFEENNIARLISRILTESPQSPRIYQPDIPKELESVVLKCLAKNPDHRYRDYDSLRQVLIPFSSQSPSPAAPGARLAAGLIDSLLIPLLSFFIISFAAFLAGFSIGFVGINNIETTAQSTDLNGVMYSLTLSFVSNALYFLYFWISESIWGAGLGKKLFRLRVATSGGTRPAWILIGIRALVFCWVPFVAYALYPLGESPGIEVVIFFVSFLLLIFLFATARRRNGWRGVHEYVSNTRVIQYQAAPKRIQPLVNQNASDSNQIVSRLGRFEIIQKIWDKQNESLSIGRDPSVNRLVWIYQQTPGIPSLPPDRRTLARPGRLRWIDGRRSDSEAWDVYEYIPGQSLPNALKETRSWLLARQVLLDLSRELDAVRTHKEYLKLSLDRIWLGADGRVRILPFSSCSEETESSILSDPDDEQIQTFLFQISELVTGREIPQTADSETLKPVFVPERVHQILEKLRECRFESLAKFSADLENIEVLKAEVSRIRRMLPILVSWLPVMMMAIPVLVIGIFEVRIILDDPEIAEMTIYLGRLDRLEKREAASEPELDAFRDYIAAKFGPRLAEFETLSKEIITIRPEEVQLAKELYERYQAQDSPDIEAASKSARRFIEPLERRANVQTLWLIIRLISAIGMLAVGPLALLGLIIGLIFPWGLLLRLFGITVIDEMGKVASRSRATLRNFLVWLPGLVCASWIPSIWLPYSIRDQFWLLFTEFAVIGICLIIYVISFFLALLNPDQGFPDRLLRTRLVRR